ncbi:hypothetical protein ACT4Z5_18540 (plasmid) [Acinetobacter baumannii]
MGIGVTDDYIALQAALLSGKPIRLGAKRYMTSKTLYAYGGNLNIEGVSSNVSFIHKTTNAKLDRTTPVLAPNGDVFDCNVDAVLVLIPPNKSYFKKSRITGLKLTRLGYAENEGYCLFAPFLAESYFFDMMLWNGLVGFYSRNIWMCTFIRCQVEAAGGWVIGGYRNEVGNGGTTCTFISCWSTQTRSGYYAWNVRLSSSNFISCVADYCGKSDSIAEGVWDIYDADVTISRTTAEASYMKSFMRVRQGSVILDGVYSWDVALLSSNSNYAFQFLGCRADVQNIKLGLKYTHSDPTYGSQVPNFMDVNSAAVVFAKNLIPSPAITGINNDTSYQIRVQNSSNLHYDSDGSTYEVSQGLNSAMPSNTTPVYSTDKIIRTSAVVETDELRVTNKDKHIQNIRSGSGFWNTGHVVLGDFHIWVDSERSGLRMKGGAPTSNLDGYPVGGYGAGLQGPTANRPTTALYAGIMYFDTTLGHPIWYRTSDNKWITSTGVIV